jgi:hypothetical protein
MTSYRIPGPAGALQEALRRGQPAPLIQVRAFFKQKTNTMRSSPTYALHNDRRNNHPPFFTAAPAVSPRRLVATRSVGPTSPSFPLFVSSICTTQTQDASGTGPSGSRNEGTPASTSAADSPWFQLSSWKRMLAALDLPVFDPASPMLRTNVVGAVQVASS